MTFITQLHKSRSGNILLIQGFEKSSCRKLYYYLQAAAGKEPLVMGLKTVSAAILEKYGTVLKSGYGYAPPARVQEEIRTKYCPE